MVKITGTTRSKSLIQSIVRDLRGKRTQTRTVDYDVFAKDRRASLVTHDFRGVMHNSSQIYMQGLRASIGNQSGHILIEQKPWHVTTKKAVGQIMGFLEAIAPDSGNVKRFAIKETSEKQTRDFVERRENVISSRASLEKTIHGSNPDKAMKEPSEAHAVL